MPGTKTATPTPTSKASPPAEARNPRDGHEQPSNDRGGNGGPSLEKVTVNLSAKSVAALRNAAGRTDETKTDVINRAIQLYSYILDQIAAGSSLYIRDQDKSELERLTFL